MKRQFVIWTFIISSLTGYSQDLSVDATYFDKHGNPYKIERKYTNNETIIYVRHDNQNSVCVKRITSKIQDTTIIEETDYTIIREKTKLEKFMDCDKWTIISNDNGDTVKLIGYIEEELIGDTVLIGDAAKKSWNFANGKKDERVPMILAGNLTVSLDSLLPEESFKAYFVNGLPLKIVRFNSKQKKQSMTTCDLSGNSMICNSYFFKDKIELYKTDTIIWNKDTAEIKWSVFRYDWNEKTTIHYEVKGNTLTISKDSKLKEIEFLDSKDLFKNLLVGNLLYGDALYYMELRLFDRQKTVKVTSANGKMTTNKYTFDKQGRITTQETFNYQELQKKITYEYKWN